MGLQDGLPWFSILRWTVEQMRQEPGFRKIRLDEAANQIFFSVHGKGDAERRYRLSIEHGWPQVVQLGGPPESRS